MRNMRLSDLEKRSNKYFTRLGKLSPNLPIYIAEYIAERSYEALPKYLKRNVEEFDRKRWIQVAAHDLQYSGKQSGMDIYKSIRNAAEGEFRNSHRGTARDIWAEFKSQERPLYNHYNTYVYRLGYSASNYFFDNVNIKIEEPIVYANLALPSKPGKYSYSQLVLKYNYSGGYFMEAYMY